MAILLDFKKVREDGQEVEYTYGRSMAMDRSMVIDKLSQEGRPQEGDRDPYFACVYVKILRFYRSEGRWPDGGAYAA